MATTRTEGHRLFKAWWKKEAERRKREGEPVLSRAAFARTVRLGSGQAVSGWLRNVTRPDRDLWPVLRAICGIAESAWMTREERARDEERREVADAVGSTGTAA